CDHDALDLTRSLPDLAPLRVAHHSLNWIVRGIAVSTENLDRFGRRPHCQLRAEELGHCRFLLEGLAVLFEPRRVVQEMSSRFNFHGHVGELKAHALKAADRLAELLADTAIPQALLKSPF